MVSLSLSVLIPAPLCFVDFSARERATGQPTAASLHCANMAVTVDNAAPSRVEAIDTLSALLAALKHYL